MKLRNHLAWFLPCALSLASLHAETVSRIVHFDPNGTVTRSIFRNGIEYRVATDGRTAVVLVGYPGMLSGKVYSQTVAVYRRASEPITFDRENFTGQMNDLDRTLALTRDGDEAVSKERKRQMRVAAIGNLLGAVSTNMSTTQTASIADNTGYRATVSVPDYAAQASERAREESVVDRVEREAGIAQQSVLRKNTLEQGQFVAGSIFFAKPKTKDGKRATLTSISVTIDGTLFSF